MRKRWKENTPHEELQHFPECLIVLNVWNETFARNEKDVANKTTLLLKWHLRNASQRLLLLDPFCRGHDENSALFNRKQERKKTIKNKMNTGKWKKKKKHHHGCNQKDKNPFGILPQYQHPALYEFFLLTYSLDSVNVAQYNAQLYGWKLNRYFGHCRRRCRRRHLHSRCHTLTHPWIRKDGWSM